MNENGEMTLSTGGDVLDMDALLAAERAHPGPPAGAQARVWSRLEASVGGGGASAAGSGHARTASAGHAAAPPTGLAGLSAGASLAGLVAGAVLLLTPTADHAESWSAPGPIPVATAAPVVAPPAAPPVPRPAPVFAAAPAPKVAPPTRPTAAALEPSAAPRPRFEPLKVPVAVPNKPTVAKAEASPSGTAKGEAKKANGKERTKRTRPQADPDAERKLIESARKALRSGNARLAIKKAREHRRTFPRGALTQEREALWVRALVKSGSYKQARKRGAGFLKRFPRSLHKRAVQSALKRIDSVGSKDRAGDTKTP